MGFSAIVARPAAADAADRRDGARDRRRQAGLPGHHRQPGFQPARGAQGARGSSRDPDRPLCLPERLGLAARPRAGDAAACRPRPLPAAVRAGRARAPRRSARHLCRPPADRTSPACSRAAEAQRQRPVPSRRRSQDAARCCPARARARSSRLIEPFGETRRDPARPRQPAARAAADRAARRATMVEAATANWPEQARDHRRRRGQMAGLRRSRRRALRVGNRVAGTGARRRAAGRPATSSTGWRNRLQRS